MSVRTRKLIGLIVLLSGLISYILFCLFLADFIVLDHWLVRLAFYLFFGIVWIFPTKRLLFWMNRPDAA